MQLVELVVNLRPTKMTAAHFTVLNTKYSTLLRVTGANGGITCAISAERGTTMGSGYAV